MVDFIGRPRPTAALHCYLIQAAAFGLVLYFFLSWDFSALAYVPADAFERPTRPGLFVYWKTPWFYYSTGQWLYDVFPRPGVQVLWSLQIAVLAFAALGLFGVAPRFMAWLVLIVASHLVGIFLIASDTMDASTTVLMFMVFLVAVFPSCGYYRIGKPARPLEVSAHYHGPVFLLLFFMVAYYFFSAVNKIIDVGFDWALYAHLDLFSVAAIEKSIFPTTWATSLVFSDLLSDPSFALLSAALVFGLELAAPVALFWPRIIAPFFVFFAGMHGAIYLSHGYGYWSNIVADLIVIHAGVAWMRLTASSDRPSLSRRFLRRTLGA